MSHAIINGFERGKKTSAQVLISYKGGTSFQDQSQSAGSKACPRRSTAE